MNNKSDVAADPHRPEILVPGAIELMEAHSGTCRIDLQIECRRLCRLLLVARQATQAVGKGVGYPENSVLEWLLVPCMGEIAAGAPESTFKLLDWRSKEIIQGLLDHTIDFGIVRRTALVKPLKFRPLGKYGYGIFAAPKLHPKSNASIASLPLAVAIGGEFLRLFTDAARKANVTPVIAYHCTSFTQAAQLARCGAAAAILPNIAGPYIDRDTRIFSTPWLNVLNRDLGLAWSDRLINTRPKARELSTKLHACLKTKMASIS